MSNSVSIRRALFILAFFFITGYLLPLHNYPYRTFFNDLSGISGVFVGLFYLAYSARSPVRLPSAFVLPLSLIIIIGLQALNGFLLYPIDCLFPILTLIGFSAALVLGATIANADKGMAEISFTLAWTFIISCLFSLLCQHVQILNLNWSPWVYPLAAEGFHRPFANIGQPNLLALLFCFSVISVWYLYLMQQIKPRSALVIVLMLLWGTALTMSRTAWLILPLFIVFCWNQPKHTRRIAKKVLMGLLLIFILMVIFTPDILIFLGSNADTLQHRAGQNSIRLILWDQAWSFSLLHPWLGAGWNQFGTEQVKYAQFFPPVEYADHVHNIILNLADEIGWPLTILIFGLAAYWFYCCCIKRWSNVQVRFLGLIIIAVMVHSMIEYPLWFGIFSVPFAFIIGTLHSSQLGYKDFSIDRWFAGIIAIVFLGVSIFLCHDVAHISRAFKAIQNQKAPINLKAVFPKPLLTASPQFYEYLYVRELEISPRYAKENIPIFEKQALRFGFSPVLESLAFLYALDNRPKSALIMLTKIERLHDENTDDYIDIYRNWESLATSDPTYFSEIFRHMPLPLKFSKSDKE